MLLTGLLRMTAVALMLVIAGVGYRHGSLKGTVVLGLGLVAAVGLLVLATAVYTSQS